MGRSSAVALVCTDAGFPPDVPDFHRGVQGARCKVVTKWMEVHTETAGAMASQSPGYCTPLVSMHFWPQAEMLRDVDFASLSVFSTERRKKCNQ